MSDSAKLAEVVFQWYERKECVRWSDVSSLCEQIGFNQLSEALALLTSLVRFIVVS